MKFLERLLIGVSIASFIVTLIAVGVLVAMLLGWIK